MLTGGCFCGAVRYQVRGTPYNATLCHCRDCRRVTGAPLVAWFSCRPDDFIFTHGTPRQLASSTEVMRAFCAECGTALTYARKDLPEEIDVTTASLDDPSSVPPVDQTQHSRRLDWIDTIDSLPAFTGARGSLGLPTEP